MYVSLKLLATGAMRDNVRREKISLYKNDYLCSGLTELNLGTNVRMCVPT